MNIVKLFIIVLCSSPLSAFSQYYNQEVVGTVNIEIVDNSFLNVVGSAYNKTELNKTLRYVLSVIKTNKEGGNTSNNKQEGRFVLEAGVKKNLSTTSINAEANNRTIILLLIYDENDQIVGKDRKVLNGIEGEEDLIQNDATAVSENIDVKKSKKDGFILKGMVIENTKTKAGGDFYDLFYSSYLSQNIDGERIVKIEEKLAIANNTQIQVFVGDDVVMQFIMNPRNQYLTTMAEQAVYRVNFYFQRLRNQKNQVIRY